MGIGKAGNPDMMDGVTDGMIVGSATEVRSYASHASIHY